MAEGDNEPAFFYALPQAKTDIDPKTSDSVSDKSDMLESLSSLGLEQDKIQVIIEHGGNFLQKPNVLAKKLKISIDLATKAINILKDSKQCSQRILSSEDKKKIENCLKENPEIESHEDIAFISEVSEELVSKYLEQRPLTDEQKKRIQESYNLGNSISDISKLLNIAKVKVSDFVEATFVTFSGENGKIVFDIITQHCGEMSKSSLRQKIKSKNLKLQNQLCCVLSSENKSDYDTVSQYLSRFEESKDVLKINTSLAIQDINTIKQNSNESIEQISSKLKKVEWVISQYLKQYFVHPVEDKHKTELQENQIINIFKTFGTKTFSLDNYRTILTLPLKDIISRIEGIKKSSKADILFELLPLIFHYLKCSLPLEVIARVFAKVSGLSLTTHDLFHVIFQLSDPVLRGLCVEDYSFSNPVPLYYPKLKHPQSISDVHTQIENQSSEVQFEICKELWYCLEQYNGLISFGVGRASWNTVGKSTLLDLIFETDFVKENPQNGAFHFRSIDIQLTKNLFGEKSKSGSESTKWAYIDCHGCSDLSVIQVLCSHLDVALIHVCYNDYKNNKAELDRELSQFKLKHIYILIRDNIDSDEVTIESKQNAETYISIPELTKKNAISFSVLRELKTIGYEILHLPIKDPKLIDSQFLSEVMQNLNIHFANDILLDNQLIKNITLLFDDTKTSQSDVLKYYPNFVEFMSSHYQASHEVDQNEIDKLNSNCQNLDRKLKNVEMGNIVKYFNCMLKKENITLLLCKLSRELSELANVKREPGLNFKLTIEILWRENLLFFKYARDAEKSSNQDHKELFASNYSKHVEIGEAFELIDGDNLRFFNKEIDLLLIQHYEKQTKLLDQINRDKSVKIKAAPIVVSIFGPQSSGKSTLLNYCFGCKFLTSAGRCTRGIYGSLSKLDRPVNLSQSFLILDTEGLDAIERDNIKDTSMIHFDRTMVLFCLSVSQVVIINVKGDIGSKMQNLLQICAYSLNRLKVSKVKAPKIFFVLNQQADPDPNKHLDAMNLLMEKLNSEFALIETDEGVEISDLIQVSRKNLFILPTAFNSKQMNDTSAKLFDSDVIKLSPTVAFADKCTNLRLAIIEQLDHMPQDDRTPFQNMSEWLDMAGVIWNTIIQYQDIVQYRNFEELKCNNKLDKIIAELMEKHFNNHQADFTTLTKGLCEEIKKISSYSPFGILSTEYMSKFDEVFETYQNKYNKEFRASCDGDRFLRKMEHICDERETNIRRLIYSVRKRYRDHIILQIKSVLIEINLSESKKKFTAVFTQNVDKYLQYSVAEQEIAFQKMWDESYGIEDSGEEIREREENFFNLYSIFKMECNTMEQNQKLLELFQVQAYNLDAIINSIKSTIMNKFVECSSVRSERFIYELNRLHAPIKEMIPYNGSPNYSYLCQESLYTIEKSHLEKTYINPMKWIPSECENLLQYCSGLYNHPDITWNPNRPTQTRLLIGNLRDPNNSKASTWDKFINDISTDILQLLDSNSDVSPVVVKQIIHALYYRIKLMNYEIGFIGAGLSDSAERTLSTLAFAYAFKYLWKNKVKIRQKNTERKNLERKALLQFFNLKIECRKMALGRWNRESMKENDKEISRRYCLDYVESVKRGLKTSLQHSLRDMFDGICSEESLSHEVILFLAYDRVNDELLKNPRNGSTDTKNIVVQYICDRNQVLQQIFLEEWEEVEAKLYLEVSKNMDLDFVRHIRGLKSILRELLKDLKNTHEHMAKGFHSDKFFEIVNHNNYSYIEIKDIPFKAATIYLKQYLDPALTPDKFNEFISNIFQVGGIEIKMCEAYRLPSKQSKTALDDDNFRKLVNTGMFNDTELIFNIYDYVQHFLFVLENYSNELSQDEFQEMAASLKTEFRTNVIGCPSQCPSCGKFCERKIHNEGKCQIKTGHQISSMGGKVWNADKDNTAVLFMCDDYKNYTRVTSPCGDMEWGEFKDRCGSEWNWDLPIEEKYKSKQKSNPEFMKNIWNKFGRAILQYQYKSIGNKIKFVPYSTFEEVIQSLLPINYFICFVIDGTGSMGRDIYRVGVSVRQLISNFILRGNSAQFRVVIYRDHCDDNIIETFPNGEEFTPEHNAVTEFLNHVKADGGGDIPEAVLDGLATAATQSAWKCAPRDKNMIIHIFDAPPHGDFPNFTEHSHYSSRKNCCCCNQDTICKFKWDRDVWNILQKFKIEYHAINTRLRSYDTDSYGKILKTIMTYVSTSFNTDLIFSNYELKMKQELGSLCDNFQVVGKEVVNDAILKIFVDFKKK